MSSESKETFRSIAGGAGVVTGERLLKVLRFASEHEFAIPAVNCTTSSSVVAVLEASRDSKSPVMIQFSQGGSQFFAGKGLKNDKQQASIAGAIAAGHYVRQMAKLYDVPVILHSDHCAKELLPWFDGMLEADEEYFKQHGEPLYSSHMLDLSEEKLDENLSICKKYFARMAKINLMLELEIGVTGGEEDGVDNTGVDNNSLYSQPEEVWQTFEELSAIGPMFTIAAAFGNVHGVYAPGNVRLHPVILGNSQKFIAEKLGDKSKLEKPALLVFHGGSGSEKDKIDTAIKYGVVKMNIDTDTQWAYWDGIRAFEKDKHDYLQGQIGNPEGKDKPNKKIYDPRVWLREGEKSMAKRVKEAFADLHCLGKLDKF